MTTPLTIQRIEELANLALSRPAAVRTIQELLRREAPPGSNAERWSAELDGLVADLPALLEAARRLLELEEKLRGWMLDKRVSCAEAWCQSDRVNEALPELGEVIGDHLGYPEYDEETGELGWTPPGESK